jgi:hypothetical protein
MATTMTAKPILPDFTRWSWASVAERQWWNPLFEQAHHAIRMMERESVVAGIRRACWQPVPPQELVDAMRWAQQHELLCIVTHQVLASKGGYVSKMQSAGPKDDFVYRCLFIKPEHYAAAAPALALVRNDHDMGTLLGYPSCCQDAFAATWGKGQVDSTWEQWQATGSHKSVDILPHTLLRWLGIRAVPHMPCTYDCAPSNDMARSLLALGCELGYKEDMILLKEVLQWPVKYSRLFGIAEVVTPAVKISTRTDWTPTKESFEKDGHYNKPEAWLWTDNGYSDPGAMRRAHSVLINSLVDVPQKSRVFDLGCGNGLLLRRLTIQRPDLKIGGVDVNANAIAHAPRMLGKWMTGTIEACLWAGWFEPTVAVISVQRLLDMTPETVKAVVHSVPSLYVYGYADTLKAEPLEALTARIGAGTLQMLQKTPDVSVGLLSSS